MANDFLDGIEFNSKRTVKRSRSILSDLDDLDEEVSLPSSLFSKSNKKNESKEDKKKNSYDDDEKESSDITDDWMATLTSFRAPKANKKKKSLFDGFDLDGKKKKKNKDKKNGSTISHKKEFEPEMALLRNLQIEQNKFVDSLQRKYNQLENTKSTARGVGKYTTDLINSITSARSVSMQLVDKIISTKKTIADLEFKERKEFGSNSGSEQQNLTNYASTYLKQMMTVGRNNIVGQQQAYDNFEDIEDSDDLFSSITDSLGDTDRSEDVEKYLKYENDNIEVYVIWHDSKTDCDVDEQYDYIAYNQEGDIIDDYPLPEKTKMNINRSTNTATDLYGNKYKMIVD